MYNGFRELVANWAAIQTALASTGFGRKHEQTAASRIGGLNS